MTSHQPNLPRHVFVYGTLRAGQANDINRLRPAPCFVAQARVLGTMYHLGGYPGVLLGGKQSAVGEVYAIDAALERVLDEIEEIYPQQKDEYSKREIEVGVNGRQLLCLVYEINKRYVANRPEIAGGDWVNR